MKNNYFKFLGFFGLILISFNGISQNGLLESQYGSKIQTYLEQEKESYNLSISDISDLSVSKEFYSQKSKITHVYVNQRFQGINIYNAISSVAVLDNSVFYYANNFIGNIGDRVNTVTPQINAETAIERAAAQLNLGVIGNLDLIESNGKKFLFNDGGISKRQIPVELVYYLNNEGELLLSWDMSIYTMDAKNWWSVRIDALSGEIINQNDWILTCNFGDANHVNHNHANQKNIQDFTLFKRNSLLVDGSQYNVYAIPTESPNHGGRTLLSEPAAANASPFGWHDTNGTAGAEFTSTRGNNVWAVEDRDANNVGGYSPNGTAALNFDFPLNLNQAPALYDDVSITNLFYMNNIMHDVWYQYGFDEESGNFQEDNFGKGGLGSDSVVVEVRETNTFNNAFMMNAVDGENPVLLLYLFIKSDTTYLRVDGYEYFTIVVVLGIYKRIVLYARDCSK